MSDETLPEIVDMRNEKGLGWRFFQLDGAWHFLLDETRLAAAVARSRRTQAMAIRDEDVIVCAHGKCGTHWLWEIVTMVTAGRAEYSRHQKEVAMLGATIFDTADDMPSPRILNSHLTLKLLPRQLIEKKTKIIQMHRNPKDVYVSMFSHFSGMKPPSPIYFDGTFDDWIDLITEGRVLNHYFHYIRAWQEDKEKYPDLPTLTLYYEDMKKNPVRGVRLVAEFLEKDISDELCEQIAEACSFQKLKQADSEVKTTTFGHLWKDGAVGMYRKGEVGDWKNWLTVAQNEKFDAWMEKEMKDVKGIKFKFV